MRFQQAIVRIGVEVNGDVFFECGFKFCFERLYEFRYPMVALVIFLTIGNKDVVFVDPGVGNQALALISGAVDAAIVSVEQRYAGVDSGMKELMYLGNEVKNSWGTTATSEKFIKEQPKLMVGFMRATLKALRLIKRDRDGTIAAFAKFSGLTPAQSTRLYDDLIGTFTANGTVDVETQKSDLEAIRQVLDGKEALEPVRVFDFSAALEADRQLNKLGWKP